MKILHITSNFPCKSFIGGSKNIKNLIESIENYVDINYTLISSRYKREYLINNNNVRVLRLKYLPLSILFIYKYYISRKKASNINFSDNFDIIHSHTFITDGIIAEKLAKKFNSKLFLSINNTDINLYFKYRKDLFWLYRKLYNKANIIFVPSNAYKIRSKKFFKTICRINDFKKLIVIPRPLDDFWYKQTQQKIKTNNKFKVITVGSFLKNKGIENSIKAVKSCLNKGIDLEYHLIGNGSLYPYLEKKYNCKNIIFHGKIENLVTLRNLYMSSNIFLLNSFSETFGLVYAEALSQGIPVIHSKNEGIDGYFNDKEIAFPVNPKNINEIINAISFFYLRRSYLKSRIKQKCINSAKIFKKEIIAKKVIKCYEK